MTNQTITQAGYKYLYFDKAENTHVLYNVAIKTVEVFAKSKNFSGWGLKYKNTDLEFISSWEPSRLERFIKGLNSVFNFGEQHPGFTNAYRLLRYTLTPEKWK